MAPRPVTVDFLDLDSIYLIQIMKNYNNNW